MQRNTFGSILFLILIITVTDRAGAELAPPPGLFIEGYPQQLSYAPGDTVQLCCSSTAGKFQLVIERVGKERTRVMEQKEISVGHHPVPDRASSHGCGWPAAYEFSIPGDWKSGYYEATLTVRDQGGAYTHRNRREASSSLFFIVRAAPDKHSNILIQLSTNTYNAYTNWGGHSLYAYHDRDGVQGHRVSFDRPIYSQFGRWELPFIQWAERNGIELDYAANSDLEFHPEILKNYRLVLSVGHDEYWSAPMRDHLEQYITDGGNVAFFSGNTCCWQVRSEDHGRALTCYKQWYNIDPLFRAGDHKLLSTLWSHHLIGRPENTLTGVCFLHGGYHRSHGQYMDGPGSFEVHRPDHWIFAETDLKQGDRFGGEATIVGYECDGCEIEWRDKMPFPTHKDGTPESFVVLGTCPARWHPGDSWWYEEFPTDREGHAVLGMYTRGGTVFTCGSTDWAHGLTGQTPVVERITRNILNKLSNKE